MQVLATAFILIAALITPQKRVVYVASVQGIIGPVTAEFIIRAIDQAEEAKSELLIITLDTPGGLDQSMRLIVKRILKSKIPVCVYVYPSGARAASAGVFITLAAHIAAMAPGTNIGAAHPVALNQKMDSTMIKKVTNDAIAYIKSIAKARHRNEKWAEDAVKKSISTPASEALKMHVIDYIAQDLNELLNKLDSTKVAIEADTFLLLTKNVKIHKIKMGFREKFQAIITNPNVAYILLILGFYGLFFELSHPGAVLPGIIGTISLILAFYAFQTLPVNFAGILLILIAMVLFIAEIKVHSHGLLALGGIVSLFIGSIMLYNTPLPYMKASMSTIITVVVLTSLFFLLLVFLAVKAHLSRPKTGLEGMIGLKGVAKTKITSKGGTVLVHGELWQATSEEPIEKGEKIEVVASDGLTLKVRKLTENENSNNF